MSPWPSRVSAPPWSRITRESTCEATANAIRAGMLTLIVPVITSVEPLGRQHQVDADRAGLLGQPDDRVLDLGRGDHHQIGELVDHAEDVGQGRLARALAGAVQLDQVSARASLITA